MYMLLSDIHIYKDVVIQFILFYWAKCNSDVYDCKKSSIELICFVPRLMIIHGRIKTLCKTNLLRDSPVKISESLHVRELFDRKMQHYSAYNAVQRVWWAKATVSRIYGR